MRVKNKYPIFIITGLIACGKSTFSKMLVKYLGATYINADTIGHDVLIELSELVVSKFGSQILNENGIIDRKKLGSIVFADKAKLLMLESILHPVINKKIETILVEPLAVDIDYHSSGIGSSLINTGLSIAKKLGYKSSFLIGDINYYKKFNFIESDNFSIYTSDKHSDEHLLALELETDALKDIKGCLHLYWAEDNLSDNFKNPH